MGTIKLQNIRTYSFHGCLEEESIIGSDYLVNLEVKTDLKRIFQIIKASTYRGFIPVETLGQGDPAKKVAIFIQEVITALK